MLLALDVGNRKIKLALFENNEIKKKETFSDFEKLKFSLVKIDFNSVAISSVNPITTKRLLSYLQTRLEKPPFLLNYEASFNIDIGYKSPHSLGMDRVCGVEGANYLQKVNQNNEKAILTVDLGTATTINYLNSNKKFIGGAIAPGVYTMIKALEHNTALLPSVDPHEYKNFIGTDTPSSIVTGVVNATIGLIERFYNKISKEEKDITLFITGGNSMFILPYFEIQYHYCPELNLIGLKEIYKLNTSKEGD